MFFDFELDDSLIAVMPRVKRDECRLMVADAGDESINCIQFADIIDYFGESDLLVLNDTKVLPARIKAERLSTGAEIELLLERQIDEKSWYVLTRAKAGRPAELNVITGNGGGIRAELKTEKVISVSKRVLTFERPVGVKEIETWGLMPVPPYIQKLRDQVKGGEDYEIYDRDGYQTVYARHTGSIAAPTAGLHFTERIIEGIKAKGTEVVYLTLHVGYSTFQPVTTEIHQHKMGEEQFFISKETVERLANAKKNNKRITAVGTTSARVLESAVSAIINKNVEEISGSTSLFIFPGYQFKMVDRLVTNFHMPKSTLILLASAFAGEELLQKTYETAKKEKFLFYSYGDAMLINRR